MTAATTTDPRWDAFSAAGRFYDEMAPQETDSTGVRIGKEVLRWSPVVGLVRLLVRWSRCEPGHGLSAFSPSWKDRFE